MPDPRRLYDSKDMAGAILYAKRLATDESDAYPVLVNTNGALITSPTGGVTLTGSTGSISATLGTISLTPTNKIKVYAFSLTTTSSTEVTCIFYSGTMASGVELWRATLMAPSGANSGANLAVSPPGFLFASRTASAVSLSLSTAVLVHYSISYFDEA